MFSIEQPKLSNVLCIVNEALTGYRLLVPQGGDHSIKSVDYLLKYCNSIAKINVYRHEQHHEPPIPRSLVLSPSKEDGVYQIWLLSGMRLCWERFTLCKELFHLLIDLKDEDRYFCNMDLESHVDQYLIAAEPTANNATTPSVQAELLAEIAAMEFMFPYEHRLHQRKEDSGDVAEKYKVPRMLIEKYCSEQYMRYLDPKNSFP